MKTNFHIVLFSLLLISAAFLSNTASAQVPEKKIENTQQVSYSDDSFPRLKWDVSTDIQFLFKDYESQGDILVRQNKVKLKKTWGIQYSAIRYRLQLKHFKTDKERENYKQLESFPDLTYYRINAEYNELENTTIGAGVGYEWQQYYGRFMIHYGTDLMFGLSRREREYVSLFATNSPSYPGEKIDIYEFSNRGITKSTSFALAPFFGMRYFIHPMISVTAETQLRFGYALEKEDFSKDNYYHAYWYDQRANSKSQTIFANYKPVSLIGVSFHFGK